MIGAKVPTVLLQAIFLMATLLASVLAKADAATLSAEASPDLVIAIRPSVDLDVRSDVSVPNELTLAEIVDPATIVSGARENVMRLLGTVTLTDRPKVGEERVFSQEGLEAIVPEATRRLQAAGHSVQWKIPKRSRITRMGRFDRERVVQDLKREFARFCLGCDADIKSVDWPKIFASNSDEEVRGWRLIMRSDRPRGSFAVPLELELSDGAKRMVMLSGRVEFTQEVPVATRAIQGGEKLAAKDFRRERRNVTFATDAVATNDDLMASEAARGLAVGETIWKRSVRREILLRYGDPVRVQVGGESWLIAADAIAQGSASVGDSVRVKIGRTQKLVSGILKEKGLVEVQ